ncbi:hypothetical protein CPB86DRAFT_868449 [Serendipita vermifera]|nr:hypothetical protein CPB86DRAFT_868449 [Serendipita vermifera]
MASLQRNRIISIRRNTLQIIRRELQTTTRVLAKVGSKGNEPARDSSPATAISTEPPSAKKNTTNLSLHPLWTDVSDQSDLKEFNTELIEPKSVGTAFKFPQRFPDPLRIFGVPRSIAKDFNFLSKPFSVIRQATVDIVEQLEKSKDPNNDSRVVITGASGSGKSYLLLQALSYCIAKEWITLYIPRAIDLINCTTPYNHDPRTQTFLQPVLSAALLRQLRDTEHPGLDKLKISSAFPMENSPGSVPPVGSSLGQIMDYGIREVSVAPFVLEFVLAELATQKEYPFLLAIDDFQALYCRSLYKTPQFLPVESHHLSVPRLLLEYACGSRKINNGMILGALSLYNTSFLPTTELYEALNLDLSHGKRPDAYTKRSEVYQHYAEGLQSFKVPERLDIKEAAGIFDVWIKDRARHSTPSDQLFLSKYCESGGNAREFMWRGLMTTLDT